MTTSLDTDVITPQVFREALALFPSGVTALCAEIDGRPVGMVASSFTSVSLEPPLVSVCVAHTSSTWPQLSKAPRLGVSVLAQGHGPIARQLASKGIERFRDVTWLASPEGSVFVYESALWLECTVTQELEAGDHAIVLLEIQRLSTYPDVSPMVFHSSRFRGLEADEPV